MKRKILAIAIVFVMLFTALPMAMTVSAGIGPPLAVCTCDPGDKDPCPWCGLCRIDENCLCSGSITIQKANNLTLEGQKFQIYKVFELKMDIIAGTYDYTITSDFEDFAKGDTFFDALIAQVYTTPAATDPKTLKEFLYDVNNADGTDLKADQEIALTHWLQEYIDDNSLTPMIADKQATTPFSQIVISDIPLGYYFITGSGYNPTQGSLGTGIDRKVTALSMLTTTAADAIVTLKADAPDINKKVKHENLDENKYTCALCGDSNPSNDCPYCADDWQDWTDADIGDTLQFQLDSKVPDMRGYTTYAYTVYDFMSKGLTFDPDTLVVKVDGDTLTAGTDYNVTYSTNGTSYALTSIPNPYPEGLYIKIDFVDFIDYKDDAGAPILITYSATLNDKAVINQDTSSNGNPNDVWLEYSNNPNLDQTGSRGRTPIRRVRVFTFEVPIIKVDENQPIPNPLAGAIFQLYKESGGAFSWNSNTNTATNGTLISFKNIDATNYMYSSTTGVALPAAISPAKYPVAIANTVYNSFITTTSGAVNLRGLKAGVYYLVEISAPNDYNKLKDAIKVTIGYTTNDGAVAGGNTTDHVSNLVDFTSLRTLKRGEASVELYKIENRRGILFPETGSTGTTIFIIIGSILTLGAGTFLAIRSRMASVKRRREEDDSYSIIG